MRALILLLIFPVCAFSQHENAITWLNKNSVKIRTVQAGNGFNDLMPLRSILKDKRIVALGEATHGTKEIFQMKHRMLEFLVEEMGFRYFAIEANLTEAYAVNDYVMYGRGDPQKALDGLYFWTWNTREVMAMIEWMRKYNRDKPDKDKVRFYGFDMQAQTVAINEFNQYLVRVDSIYARQVKDVITGIHSLESTYGNGHALEFSGDVRKMFARMEEQKAKYISATSEREYEIGKHNLVIVSQFIEMMSRKDTAVICQIRDSCMAENVKWLMNLEGDSARFVLWAHNGHIAKNYTDSDGQTMGYFLKKYYREQYYALGFDFYQGSFQSIGDKTGLMSFNYTMKQNSTGYFFSQTKYKLFFFDLGIAEKNPEMHRFLHDTIPSICIGALFSEKNPDQFYIKRPLAGIYDGLIFIRNTHRAEPITRPQIRTKLEIGNLMLRKEADQWVGKQFKLSAFVKVGNKTEKGQGQLWARVDKKDKSLGFFDNMDDRPVRSKEWQYGEITGIIDQDAAFLVFGCMFIGKGELYVDDISLSFLEAGQWTQVTLPDPAFESCPVNEKPSGWRLYDKKYRIFVTGQTSHSGNKCVKFKR